MRSRPRIEIAWHAALAALIGCALAATPAGAASPSATPPPSAQELWQTYPLEASPEPTTGAPRPARTAAHTRAPHAADSGGTSALERALQLAALLGAALALGFWLRRERSGRQAEAPAAAPPEPQPEPPPRVPRELEPPDPGTAWTAEIVWTKRGSHATFRAVARHGAHAEVVLTECEPVRWPPDGPRAIAAVSGAAEALSGRLTAAGWTAVGLGDTWYSRRFAWEPRRADPPAPDPAPARRARRFLPAEDWPVEQYALWRCVIEPEPEGVSFQAVVYPPGRRKGRTIARRQESTGLDIALRNAGWSPITDGPRTRFTRFVWRGDPPPTTRLDLPTHETSETP